MPKCKNNPSRHYKGTEPSPKGKGFCASGAKVGQRKRGTDGNMWIVKKIGKSQRWTKCVGKKSMKPSKPKKSLGSTIRLRVVFGYYKHDASEYDKRAISNPTNAQIKRIFTSSKPYKRINNYTDYNTDLILTSKNIKSVHVCDPPTMTRTFGEKIGNKYKGWLHSPDKLVVVDVVGILKHNKDPSRTLGVDDAFLEEYRQSVNHDFNSGESMLYGSAHASAYILEIDERKKTKLPPPNPRRWKYW